MIHNRSSIEIIISALRSHDISSLNSGLYGGQIGYAVFAMSAFQKYGTQTVDTLTIDFVRNVINKSVSKICQTANGFMTGNSGIIWGLRKLQNMGVIEQSEVLERLVDIIIQHGLSNYYSQSKSITSQNEIYPWGITLLPFWNGSETLSRYLFEEKILLCLIECERILNGDVLFPFLSAEKGCAFLHSILYFASKAYSLGIGTVRAKRIVDNITAFSHIVGHLQSSVDAAILNTLLYQTPVCMPNRADLLPYLGTIAMVYNMPKLFLPTYIRCNIGTDIFSKMSAEKLIGIGLGLVSNDDEK